MRGGVIGSSGLHLLVLLLILGLSWPPPPSRERIVPVNLVQLGDKTAAPSSPQLAPLPLTERWPWLIYVVLGAACLVLLAILGALARAALARHDARHRPV